MVVVLVIGHRRLGASHLCRIRETLAHGAQRLGFLVEDVLTYLRLLSHAVPLVCIAGEFVNFPDPQGGTGWHNVGLVALPHHMASFAEFVTVVVSDKLLKEVGAYDAIFGGLMPLIV